jgi:hypothetical protein
LLAGLVTEKSLVVITAVKFSSTIALGQSAAVPYFHTRKMKGFLEAINTTTGV